MKNYFLLSFIAFAFISCKSNEPVDIIEEIIEPAEVIIEDEITETEEAKMSFEYIDDYATLTTKDELSKEFGDVNITHDTVWLAEGTVRKYVTHIVNPKTWHHVTYFWNDETGVVDYIEAHHYFWSNVGRVKGSQRIEAKNGLYTGMRLEDLDAWNGNEIKFAGFGWDYAGNVFPSNNDKLAESNVQVTLIDIQDGYEGFDFMLGDVELNSKSNRMKEAPVVIETLTLRVNNEQ